MARKNKPGLFPVFPKAMLAYIVFICIVAFASLFSSCSPRVVQVPVEIRTESASLDSIRASVSRTDTVIKSDTVCIVVSEAGDTVRLTQTRWRERVSVRHDTVAVVRVDTLYREKAVPVSVATTEPSKKNSVLRTAAAILAVPMGYLMICLILRYHRGIVSFLKSLFKKKS